jgi:hypothetical protein
MLLPTASPLRASFASLPIRVGCVLAFALATSGALAQEKPAPDKPANDSPLSGPEVKAQTGNKTLVERDFAGKLKRVEVHPAEAAVKLLNLDEPTRAKVDAVLAQRAATMDGIVRDNLKTIVQLAGARESGNRTELQRLMRELGEAAKPLRDRGALLNELVAALPEAEGKQLKAIVTEYFGALVQERAEEAKSADREAKPTGEMEKRPDTDTPGETGANPRRNRPRGGSPSAAGGMAAEIAAIAGGELKRAYERVVGQRSKDFDELIKTLNLTPEQEGKVRKLVGDSFTATYGKASPAEKAKVFLQVYALLDEDQKATLAKRFREAK